MFCPDPLILKAKKSLCRMISPGDKVLAAVSGGMDSIALLHLLLYFQEELRFDVVIAHLNHKARDRESDEDAEFVTGLGKGLGLLTVVETVDVKDARGKLKTSFQEAARVLRYRFLEDTLRRIEGQKIALGHTADDQVETVMINLIRGSGLKGLGGMPSQRGAIIRPLHDCYRSEVEQFVRSRNLECRSDSSNTQTQYLRNRIRLDLLPRIEEYNPNFKSGLLETSEIVKSDDAYLEQQADQLFRNLSRSIPEGVALSRSAILELAPAMLKRVLRRAIQCVKGDLRRVSAVHSKDILRLLTDSGGEKRICLPGKLSVLFTGDILEIRKIPVTPESILVSQDENAVTELKVPGWTNMESAGLRFQVRLLPMERQADIGQLPHQACLDFDKTGEHILARFFRPGDRFVPLGMQGSKKLKSFFIDRKVPREQRKSIPILVTGDGDIIWVYEQQISQRYRITDKTRNLIVIEGFEPRGIPV